MKRPKWEVPDAPGTKPVGDDEVRLYHQTDSKNLSPIRRHGILHSKAKGIEGPKAIYADEKGFYGKPHDTPTVEFKSKKKDFDRPFVRKDKVDREDIIATHKPWHATVRYIKNDPDLHKEVLAGEHDHLMSGEGKYSKAIRFIKKEHKASKGK